MAGRLSVCLQNLHILLTVLKARRNRPVTDLQARTFAIWTLASAIVRFYAAYNINNKACVSLAFSSDFSRSQCPVVYQRI